MVSTVTGLSVKNQHCSTSQNLGSTPPPAPRAPSLPALLQPLRSRGCGSFACAISGTVVAEPAAVAQARCGPSPVARCQCPLETGLVASGT